ncbi:MAG: macro domain-containing protein [Bacteroidota bacterium]
MEAQINGGKLSIVQGDITEQETTAIVNAANNRLWMGAGVAGAIKRKGGEQIEHEAVAQGPIEVGGAVVTSAGALRARYVIHAAVMGQDLRTDGTKIRRAMRSALKAAEDRGIDSVSFPALGTGVGGFPMDQCASIMIDEAEIFLRATKVVNEIRFVLYDEVAFSAFAKELSRRWRGSP